MENFELIAENAEKPTTDGDGKFMEEPATDGLGEYYDEETGEVMPHPTDEPEFIEEISAPGAISVNPETSFDIVYNVQKACQNEDSYEVTINAEYRDIPDGVDITPIDFVSEIGPHGGPDPDSPEFNPEVITPFNLEPGESGSVTAEGLSVMGLYEWITPTQDFPIESLDGSGVGFEACATTSDEPAEKEPDEHEHTDGPRHEDISPYPDDVEGAEDEPAEDEQVDDETEVPVDDAETEAEEETSTEQAQPKQDAATLIETGVDVVSTAALALGFIAAGGVAVLKSNQYAKRSQ